MLAGAPLLRRSSGVHSSAGLPDVVRSHSTRVFTVQLDRPALSWNDHIHSFSPRKQALSAHVRRPRTPGLKGRERRRLLRRRHLTVLDRHLLPHHHLRVVHDRARTAIVHADLQLMARGRLVVLLGLVASQPAADGAAVQLAITGAVAPALLTLDWVLSFCSAGTRSCDPSSRATGSDCASSGSDGLSGRIRAFGLVGLVIGPVALTLASELWRQCAHDLVRS